MILSHYMVNLRYLAKESLIFSWLVDFYQFYH